MEQSYIIQEKTVAIPNTIQVLLGYFGNNKCLIIDNKTIKKFVTLPNFVLLHKKEQNLHFCLISETDLRTSLFLGESCVSKFNKIVKEIEVEFSISNTNKKYRKKLLLKGLGFRMRVIEENVLQKNSLKSLNKELLSTLELKVGYSHLKLLPFSKNIKIQIVKKTGIIIESSNKVLLGNFAREV